MKAQRVAKDFPVVCVVGSADGFDACIRLLKHLPADKGVAADGPNELKEGKRSGALQIFL